MFIEVNEVERYCFNNEKDKNGDYKYISVIIGKILVNTEHIRNVSISRFDWENKEKYIVKEGSQQYVVNFDRDRYIYTDLEGYNKIRNLVVDKENCI